MTATRQEDHDALGRTRREFLWQFRGRLRRAGAGGDARRGRPLPQRERPDLAATNDPLAPKPPHSRPKAKTVIFLFMYGGPSRSICSTPNRSCPARTARPIATRGPQGFDRQGDAARHRRGHSRGTAQSGIEVSDLFPHLAKCVDDMAIVRSMYADSFAHGSAMIQMNTGRSSRAARAWGAGPHTGWGPRTATCPAFVVLLDPRGGPIGGAPNWAAGYMPATYQGTQFRTNGDPILNLAPRAPVDRGRAAGAARLPDDRSTQPTARQGRTTRSWPPGSTAMSWPSGCRRRRPRPST